MKNNNRIVKWLARHVLKRNVGSHDATQKGFVFSVLKTNHMGGSQPDH